MTRTKNDLIMMQALPLEVKVRMTESCTQLAAIELDAFSAHLAVILNKIHHASSA